jgi:hypothetical protein
MQFAEQFAGWDLQRCTVEGKENLTAWFAHKGAEHQLALINKGEAPIQVQLTGAGGAYRAGHAICLSAPALDAKQGVVLAEVKALRVAPFSSAATRHCCSVGSKTTRHSRDL